MTAVALAAHLAHDLGLAVVVVELTDEKPSTAHAAGRRAARLALVTAGATGRANLRRRSDGRPQFPSGWTGSISHGGGWAVAAVASTDHHVAVGIDVERSDLLPLQDAALVLDESERLTARRAAEPDRWATLLWSAKESAFKAWSMLAGGLDHVDPAEIHIDVAKDGALSATSTGDLARRHPTLPLLVGRWAASTDIALTALVAGAAVRRTPAPGPRRGSRPPRGGLGTGVDERGPR